MTADTARFRDFSLSPENPVMRIAPDNYRCYPEIPLDAMMDIVALAKDKETDGMQRFKQLLDLLEAVIVPEDFDGFIARTKRGTKEQPNPSPIGIRHVKDIMPWIMEVYGLRPTQQSPESSDGSSDTNSNSTELASDTESISSVFP